MNKFILLQLLVLLLFAFGFSQEKKAEDATTLTLCWNSSLDTSARYLVYFNRYNVDEEWRLVGSTKEKSFEIAKESFKGDIAFGVRAVYYDDTSALHTSLEETACMTGDNCDTTCTLGSWYVSWHIRKPDRLKIKTD